ATAWTHERLSVRSLVKLFLCILLACGMLFAGAAAALRVAYIYGSDPTITANAFNAMLTGRGITVDLYSDATAALASTDFFQDQAIIIGDDQPAFGGYQSFTHILNANKPVVGIGNGGSQFLNFTGLPFVGNGTLFSTAGSDYKVHVADPYAPIWSTPSPVS